MDTRRVVIHDYSGHPFQVQLSRELARGGHIVQHQYCSSYESGHGRLSRVEGDPGTLSFRDVPLGRSFAKYSWRKRIQQELQYGIRASRAILRARPDVAVLCNIPLLANLLVVLLLGLRRQRYVFWHQDVYSAAIRTELQRKLGPAGTLAGFFVERAERTIARRAAHVVAITDAFLPLYRSWRIPAEHVTVIPNWAALDELPQVPQDRSWLGSLETREHLLLYSGTVGIKHDPSLLLDLATDPLLDDCTVVVVTQGKGRAWLEEARAGVPDDRLILHDYVDYDLLPTVLGSADVLLAVLEPDASKYSVPSKMLSYMCAGRPIIAVIDGTNAAARTLVEEKMGRVVANEDKAGLPRVVRSILDQPHLAAGMGSQARAYAEATFDIKRISAAFESILVGTVEHPANRTSAAGSL